MVSSPILGYPKGNGKFILDSDASDFGIGGVLSQLQDGKEVVLAYGSRTMTSEELNYCVTRKELLAVVHHIQLFEPYLIDQQFEVRTDHAFLKYLHRFKAQNGQLARWLDFLQQFDFQISLGLELVTEMLMDSLELTIIVVERNVTVNNLLILSMNLLS